MARKSAPVNLKELVSLRISNIPFDKKYLLDLVISSCYLLHSPFNNTNLGMMRSCKTFKFLVQLVITIDQSI